MTQTDCTKCIYHTDTIVAQYKGSDKGVVTEERLVCELHLRTTRPICPCFDDGKEEKQ